MGAFTTIVLGQARDDDDLFMTGGQSGTAPNMLLMIDNTAGWASPPHDPSVSADSIPAPRAAVPVTR